MTERSKKRALNSGFTLAETLLAITLMGIISVGVFGMTGSALNTYRTFTFYSDADELLTTAGYMMSGLIKNARYISFSADPDDPDEYRLAIESHLPGKSFFGTLENNADGRGIFLTAGSIKARLDPEGGVSGEMYENVTVSDIKILKDKRVCCTFRIDIKRTADDSLITSQEMTAVSFSPVSVGLP